MAARLLVNDGHAVTLHARNEQRAADALDALPAAEHVVFGDLSTLAGMRMVAAGVKACRSFDAVIHNAGIGSRRPRHETTDGLEEIFAVNVLAPYLLTELIGPVARLVFLSSSMQKGGQSSLTDPQWRSREWSGTHAYADSKLFVVALAFAFARRWPQTYSNAVDPGWVATKMGGPGGSEDFVLGSTTQAWLAVSDEPAATVTGRYFRHQVSFAANPAAYDVEFQERLLAYCARLSG